MKPSNPGTNFSISNLQKFTLNDTQVWFIRISRVIGNLYVNPYLNLRFTPTVHFGDKKFTFIDARASDSHAAFITSIRSNYLTLPLDLKYTAMRLNNYQALSTVLERFSESLLLKSSPPSHHANLSFLMAFHGICQKFHTDTYT